MVATSAVPAVISDTLPVCPPQMQHRIMGMDFLTTGVLNVEFADGSQGFLSVEAGQTMDVKVRKIFASGSTASMSVRLLIGEGF